MRARTAEELRSPERIARLIQSPGAVPKYFRKLVREQFAEAAIEFLHDTMTGEQQFTAVVVKGVKGGGQVHEVVEVEAPGAIRVRAAEALLGIAIPRQAGLVDDEGNSQSGVVLLPPLDEEVTPHGGSSNGSKEVIEEVGNFSEDRKEDRDLAPPVHEETINPLLVQHVLARRRAGRTNGNGHP